VPLADFGGGGEGAGMKALRPAEGKGSQRDGAAPHPYLGRPSAEGAGFAGFVTFLSLWGIILVMMTENVDKGSLIV
jgi:hypothetical protein